MEWVRAKKKLAENRAAVLKTDLEIAKKQNEMAKNQGSPDDIIDDFLRR